MEKVATAKRLIERTRTEQTRRTRETEGTQGVGVQIAIEDKKFRQKL